MVTTKVKGLGYVAINQTRDRFKKSDYTNSTEYYMDMYETRPDVEYKIFDTAGRVFCWQGHSIHYSTISDSFFFNNF